MHAQGGGGQFGMPLGQMGYQQGGSNPMMQGGNPQMMQGGNPQMMQGGNPQMMQGGNPQMMQGGNPQMMQGGNPQMMQAGNPQMMPSSQMQTGIAGGVQSSWQPPQPPASQVRSVHWVFSIIYDHVQCLPALSLPTCCSKWPCTSLSGHGSSR